MELDEVSKLLQQEEDEFRRENRHIKDPIKELYEEVVDEVRQFVEVCYTIISGSNKLNL